MFCFSARTLHDEYLEPRPSSMAEVYACGASAAHTYVANFASDLKTLISRQQHGTRTSHCTSAKAKSQRMGMGASRKHSSGVFSTTQSWL